MIRFEGMSFEIADLPELFRLVKLVGGREVLDALREIGAKLDSVAEFQIRLEKFMAQLDDALATLVTAVQADTSAEQAALTFIQGVPGLITAAVTEALAAGATPAQLKAVTDAAATITANSGAIQAAIVANTPGNPVVTAAPALKP